MPIWSQRVIYIQGSVLNNNDLNRTSIEKAKACFILTARIFKDRNLADQHTILRSWAIRDFAPSCVQYIQLLKCENKIHVQHASNKNFINFNCKDLIEIQFLFRICSLRR